MNFENPKERPTIGQMLASAKASDNHGELIKNYFEVLTLQLGPLVKAVDTLNRLLKEYPELIEYRQAAEYSPKEIQSVLDSYLEMFDQYTALHLDNTLKSAALITYLHKRKFEQSIDAVDVTELTKSPTTTPS